MNKERLGNCTCLTHVPLVISAFIVPTVVCWMLATCYAQESTSGKLKQTPFMFIIRDSL